MLTASLQPSVPKTRRATVAQGSLPASAVHRHTCNLTAAALDARSRALLDEVYARDFAVLGYDNSRIQTFSAGVQLRERWRFVDWGASVMDTEWV